LNLEVLHLEGDSDWAGESDQKPSHAAGLGTVRLATADLAQPPGAYLHLTLEPRRSCTTAEKNLRAIHIVYDRTDLFFCLLPDQANAEMSRWFDKNPAETSASR
jgi:hypothetical protein